MSKFTKCKNCGCYNPDRKECCFWFIERKDKKGNKGCYRSEKTKEKEFEKLDDILHEFDED